MKKWRCHVTDCDGYGRLLRTFEVLVDTGSGLAESKVFIRLCLDHADTCPDKPKVTTVRRIP